MKPTVRTLLQRLLDAGLGSEQGAQGSKYQTCLQAGQTLLPVASSDPLGSATPSSELPELSILPLLALISLTQNDLFTRLFSPG